VTVVIVTRNRRDELTHTVGLLGELTPAAPVIVVDNGSQDGTARAVRERFPGVRVLALPPRVGRGLHLLEEPQRRSKARRYVG
jgi:GT2 family glycosyltransferase